MCGILQYIIVQYNTVLYSKEKAEYTRFQYSSNIRQCVFSLLLSSTHPLQERFELHESFLILRFTQFLHQCLGFLLGELLSKVGEETEQFIANHGIVSILVVQLQDLHEVVEATLVLGVLAGLVHGEDVSLTQELGSLGLSTTDLI